jgi:long-chain acyl-CoA synthetase
MRIYDVLLTSATRDGQAPAIHFRDQSISYQTLLSEVNRLASSLRQRGVVRGDRVGILLGNCPQFTMAYYAVTALGAVCVPANPALKGAELAYIWSDAGLKMVITATALLTQVEQARAQAPTLREVVVVDGGADLPSGAASLTALLAAGAVDAIADPGCADSDPAVCLYTSGTTGHPKGALLSHRNLIANTEQTRKALQFEKSDNFLCVLPLFHSFAGTVCQNTPIALGASLTIVEMFHPVHVLEAIVSRGVTIFAGVPAMFGALLQLPAEKARSLGRVRLCVSGGAPLPVAIMQAFEQRFATILIEGDGPTECSPVTSVNPLTGARKPGTIGLPVPGCEMRIFDDREQELKDGEIGEIVVRGENVMLGYHNQPQATAEALRGGWYHTGDLGLRDADGYFSIVDRKKDMIIVSGLNVYPREVEDVLYRHPDVLDAAVLGVPDELRGESVLAVIALKPERQATAQEIIVYCRKLLANFKVPRQVIFRASLPRGGTGKVLKRLLKKELELEGRSA